MSVRHSGTSDTGRGHVCPCGRQHSKGSRARSHAPAGDHVAMTAQVYAAFANGKLETDENRHVVHYSGDCVSPMEITRNSSTGALFVLWRVRCRRCKPCLRAKQFFWARAAQIQTARAEASGDRTWFGTLTFDQANQKAALDQAFQTWADSTGNSYADWWDEPHCDERFKLVRNVMVGQVQRYWKRLRKGVKRCATCYPRKPRRQGEWDHPPQRFKYFLVFERHRNGLPHVHWLLHEEGKPVLLKQLACAWPHGFVKIKLVRGTDAGKAGFYVSKYLGKAIQARQIASVGYAKTNSPS